VPLAPWHRCEPRQEKQVQHFPCEVSLPRVLSVTLAIDTTSSRNVDEVSIPVPPMPISYVAIASYVHTY
jgi:hypothetical protein